MCIKINSDCKKLLEFLKKQDSWHILIESLEIFDTIDLDSIGRLNRQDFEIYCKLLNRNKIEANRIYNKMDIDNDGYLTIIDIFYYVKEGNNDLQF